MQPIVLAFLTTVVSAHCATIAYYRFDFGATDRPLYELTDSGGRAHHGRVLGQEPFELTTDIPAFQGLMNRPARRSTREAGMITP